MLIKIPRGWEIPESQATPEDVYLNRRKFLKAMGVVGTGMLGLLTGCQRVEGQSERLSPSPAGLPPPSKTSHLYPAKRSQRFTLDRALTEEAIAGRYNNFYEFSPAKDRVWRLVEEFATRPWQVEVTGLVAKPKVYDLDELVSRMPLEERLYRFRCVEAWSMAVPWTGFPLRALIELVEPLSAAKYVRMLTFLRPEQAPGQQDRRFPWPYFEGLTMAEATNELTLLVTGVYGHELSKQHGAPIRLIVPWKYGFKSIKSVVRLEFVEDRPRTFWNELVPREYDFWANVNPQVPHPRWSQASERVIDTGERRPTLLYNGYADFVADLYRT
jgi:sulfoxide reductase catalytic subunit YedY